MTKRSFPDQLAHELEEIGEAMQFLWGEIPAIGKLAVGIGLTVMLVAGCMDFFYVKPVDQPTGVEYEGVFDR